MNTHLGIVKILKARTAIWHFWAQVYEAIAQVSNRCQHGVELELVVVRARSIISDKGAER